MYVHSPATKHSCSRVFTDHDSALHSSIAASSNAHSKFSRKVGYGRTSSTNDSELLPYPCDTRISDEVYARIPLRRIRWSTRGHQGRRSRFRRK